MASACLESIGLSPENFLDCPPSKIPSYGWLSPRISFTREFSDEEALKSSKNKLSSKNQAMAASTTVAEKPGEPDLDISSKDFAEFEFRLEYPVGMLSADELFADGKLVPLHLSTIRHSMTSAPAASDFISSETPKSRRRNYEISSTDPYLFSPKAPRCSSRWKDLLGLKKRCQNSNAKEDLKTTSSSARSLKQFLHRSSKSSNGSTDSSLLSLPLLKDSDINESLPISACLSLSSSSSGHQHVDLHRLSLDSNKQAGTINSRNTHQIARVRVVKHRTALRKAAESAVPARGVSVDSPRMNSSGKIVFHSLERSSSSPSTFNGGPRHKHRGIERSYSANVRFTPVLNVSVCSLMGSSKSGVFGMFSSQQKKENGGGVSGNRNQHSHCRNRADRT
ncbi:hypothetical protein CASFOL_014053 [Castilleja foliolosa]|uniref:Uncharacterized protein n=1 Tax=Castilleja foliolosa TaxID=1961234 RepID=A0ABD3DLS1_9LAMI